MINHLKAFFFMAIAAPSAFAQTPLPVGTIIPESLTLTLGTPNAGNNLLQSSRGDLPRGVRRESGDGRLSCFVVTDMTVRSLAVGGIR